MLTHSVCWAARTGAAATLRQAARAPPHAHMVNAPKAALYTYRPVCHHDVRLRLHLSSCRAKDYPTAIDAYSAAIAACSGQGPALSVLYSNRAAAHIGIKRWADALADCRAALRADDKNLKAHVRCAAAGLLVDFRGYREEAAMRITAATRLSGSAGMRGASGSCVTGTALVNQVVGDVMAIIGDDAPPQVVMWLKAIYVKDTAAVVAEEKEKGNAAFR